MESAGIYWESHYAALEQAGIPVHVVNARHAHNVLGRKADVSNSEWLAPRPAGIASGSALPRKARPSPDREKNRLHKIPDDADIKLGTVWRTSTAYPPQPSSPWPIA